MSYNRLLTMLAILSLVLLATSCVKQDRRKRVQPACLHGQNADGECNSPPWQISEHCQSDYSLVSTGDSGCIFRSSSQPNGCLVAGLRAHLSINNGCVVVDSNNNNCQLSDLDKITLTCSRTIELAPAPVRLYLTINDGGFAPRIVFDSSEKVKAGAELTLEEQAYNKQDLDEDKENGKTILKMALKIPWTLNYTKEDGTEVCATGVLDGSHVSEATAGRGNICP